MKLLSLLLTAAVFTAAPYAAAQSSFDDDIYFDASKAKKKKEAAKKEVVRIVVPADFKAAEEYAGELTSSTRDIDEYNRRGIFALPDTAATDTIALDVEAGDAFANTRRIERFYNPDVIVENPDETVAEVYYTDQPIEVNVYYNSPYGYFGGPGMYYDPWYFGPGIYNPWYYGGFYNPWSWGPSWSWNWGWGPSWAWGPSWSWGWGPGWDWCWGPSWGWGGHHANTRPHYPHGNYAGSYRHAANASGGRFSNSTHNGARPASSGSNWNIGNVGSRPGTTQAYRPGATGGNRGGAVGTNNATGRRPSSSQVNSNRSNNNSSTTNRNNSSGRSTNSTNYNRSSSNSGSYNSGGSFRSGSSSMGGGGGFRSSGGTSGGGGGRRR